MVDADPFNLSSSSKEEYAVKRNSFTRYDIAKLVERPLQPSSLPVYQLKDICRDYYYGYCQSKEECSRKHSICRLQVVVNPDDRAPHLHTEPNFISLEPRIAPEGGLFDDDGPGHLAWHGPRHNNDHAEVS
ncbi:MAG: hypothetical protein L6R41_005959 [Letrouitia leprolyta]|nr:MAG: hypothetical protein L6R41_005959 [Letrouitia leprolyta]